MTRSCLSVVAEVRDPLRRSRHDPVRELLAPGLVLSRSRRQDTLGVKNERLGEVLELLEQRGRLHHTATG